MGSFSGFVFTNVKSEATFHIQRFIFFFLTARVHDTSVYKIKKSTCPPDK